jgi:hypothetical protein
LGENQIPLDGIARIMNRFLRNGNSIFIRGGSLVDERARQFNMRPRFRNRAVFVGCARDCAATLPHALRNISNIAKLFAESAFVFIENDSGDSTKSVIQNWCRTRPTARLISLDGLSESCPFRTIRLETARNSYLSLIRAEFNEFDYLFVLDLDEVNAGLIDIHAVERAVEFMARDRNYAGVFANSETYYYDLWALRHPVHCPRDIWEEACDYALAHRVTDEEAFRQTVVKRFFRISPQSLTPLEVDSAFGGFAIYKIKSILDNKRSYFGQKIKTIRLPPSEDPKEFGWQCCEHVAFNAGFRELGQRLFVLPGLVNFDAAGLNFLPSFWRSLSFDARLAVRPKLDVGGSAVR